MFFGAKLGGSFWLYWVVYFLTLANGVCECPRAPLLRVHTRALAAAPCPYAAPGRCRWRPARTPSRQIVGGRSLPRRSPLRTHPTSPLPHPHPLCTLPAPPPRPRPPAALAYFVAAVAPGMEAANAMLPLYAISLLFFSGMLMTYRVGAPGRGGGVVRSARLRRCCRRGRRPSLRAASACARLQAWARSDISQRQRRPRALTDAPVLPRPHAAAQMMHVWCRWYMFINFIMYGW